MTTTKRGVDLSSKIYDTVRERMQEGMKHFTKFTHDWKGREEEQKEMFRRARPLPLPQVRREAEKHFTPHVPRPTFQLLHAPGFPVSSAP